MKRRVGTLLIVAALVMAGLTGCDGEQKNQTSQNLTGNNGAQKENVKKDEEQKNSNAENVASMKLSEYPFTRENFPEMDGSTSLAPLAKALASTVLGESVESVEELVKFNRTTQAYRNLMNDDCSFLLASWPNEEVFDEMKHQSFECEMEEISTEALIFVVNKDNPVDNLTTQQIIDIYTGKITNWSEVGGKDEAIKAFQRNKGSGSQALMEKLVMKDTPMMQVEEETMPGAMDELMKAVKNYDNSANALGYSVYYYANDMKMADGLKIISVDGVEPNAETIRQKTYPHTNAYYCVIDKQAPKNSPERILFNWIVSEEGQKLVAHEGYVSIIDTGIEGKDQTIVASRYSRLRDEWIPDLQSGMSNGYRIYPFVGEPLYDVETSQEIGNHYGFVDETGCILADPTYINCGLMMNYGTYEKEMSSFWCFQRMITETEKEEEGQQLTVSGVASLDGKYVSDCIYQEVLAAGERVILQEKYDGGEFTIVDVNGNTIMTQKDLPDKVKNFMYLNWANDGEILCVTTKQEETYLVKVDGTVIGGPYVYGDTFQYGYCTVAVDGPSLRHGLIDENGKEVIPAEYDTLFISNEKYLCAVKDGVPQLLDYKGNVIKEAEEGMMFEFDENGNYALIPDQYDETIEYIYYNEKQEEVYRYQPNEDSRLGISSIFYHEDSDGNLILEDRLRNKSKTFANAAYADFAWNVIANSEFGYGKSEDDYIVVSGENRSYLIDKEFNVIMENSEYIQFYEDLENEKKYIVCSLEDYTIYDEDLNRIVVSKQNPIISNGKILYTDDYASRMIDNNGKEIFCYPFVKTFAD